MKTIKQVSCSSSTVQKENGDCYTTELITALCTDGTVHVMSNALAGWKQLAPIEDSK